MFVIASMVKRKYTFLIFLVIVLLGLIVISAIMGDEVIILFLILLGIIMFLSIISEVLEKFFPKNRISKFIGNIVEFIRYDLRF